jgi:plastocyanin
MVSATTTPAAVPATPVPVATTSSGGGRVIQMNLTARDIAFDPGILSAPAGSTVIMTFSNLDFGVTHNFALYTDEHATTRIFGGDFVTGPRTITYTFTVPSTPGGYIFRCDVHPDRMTGTFLVT